MTKVSSATLRETNMPFQTSTGVSRCLKVGSCTLKNKQQSLHQRKATHPP